MSQDLPLASVHPAGEQPPVEQDVAPVALTLDTWAGPVRVEWDATAPLTPYGQLPFFIEYLKTANLFDALVADCPLNLYEPERAGKA
jgi:hypothetical protein